MTIPADIDILAATAYATGIDPITYATVNVVEAHIVAHLAQHEPERLRDGDATTAIPALSGRIVADLLNAGWRMPEVTP